VINLVDSFCANMPHISSREFSKPSSPNKSNPMVEIEETKRDLTQKEEIIEAHDGEIATARGLPRDTKSWKKMGA